MGPRDVYELTNNRTSLENLTQEELNAYKKSKRHGTQVSIYGAEEDSAGAGVNRTQAAGGLATSQEQAQHHTVTYVARMDAQQNPDNYQKAQPMTSTGFEQKQDAFHRFPAHAEPLAPEPLAVLKPAQVMRMLITAYTDKQGNLHLPGYTYVEVTPRQWDFGPAANDRPSRVVPLEMQRRSKKQQERSRNMSQGVDPLEVVNPANREQQSGKR